MNLTLTQKISETPDVTSFIFRPESELRWTAGQFLHYWLPHSPTDDRKTDRYFTIASAPHEGVVRLTTRFAGDGGSTFKQALRELPLGATVEAGELDGDFIVDDSTRNHIFIAGGIGITPYRAILLDLDRRELAINVTLLYSNRDPRFVFKSELQMLAAKHPGFQIHYFASPQRIDEQAIRRAAPNSSEPTFFVSGPEPMVEAMGETLQKLGVPSEHLKQDWFPNYDAE